MGFLESLGNMFARKDATGAKPPSWLTSLKRDKAARDNSTLRRAQPTPYDFLLIDVLEASQQVDTGKVGLAAQYWSGCYRDAIFAGLIGTRTAGLVSLPREFKGSDKAVDFLSKGYGGNTSDPQSGFDMICPPQELANLLADGCGLGVAVGQLTEVDGLDFPILARLDPAGLEYDANYNVWVYRTDAGPIAITPGAGGWVLYTPGGLVQPYKQGAWQACVKAVTRKEHALLSLDEYLYRFGLPARHGTLPEGASAEDREAFQSILEDWSNTALVTGEGAEVSLLELKGDGAKVFLDLVNSCNDEIIVALGGQKVTVDGGSGFQNNDIHKAIRQDLIKNSAQSLADCLNSQVLPQALAMKFGVGAQEAFVSWNVEPAQDVKVRADQLVAAAQAFAQLTGKPLADSVDIDVLRLAEDLKIPVLQAKQITQQPPALKVVK